LSAVADRVDGSVLDDNSWVASEQYLQRHDDSPEVVFLAELLEVPLGVLDVVHSNHRAVFLESSTSDPSELCHVRSASQQVAYMDAHCSNVGSRLAGYPEYAHVPLLVELEQLGLVDGPDSQLFLDGRNERRPLEAGAGERVERLLDLLGLVHLAMELDDRDVLLTCGLLSLDEPGGVVQASNQAASDFWIEGATMARLTYLEKLLGPGHNFVRTRIRWLVEVDNAVLLQDVNGSVQG